MMNDIAAGHSHFGKLPSKPAEHQRMDVKDASNRRCFQKQSSGTGKPKEDGARGDERDVDGFQCARTKSTTTAFFPWTATTPLLYSHPQLHPLLLEYCKILTSLATAQHHLVRRKLPQCSTIA